MDTFHVYGVLLAIWDNTVLPTTRRKWTHPGDRPVFDLNAPEGWKAELASAPRVWITFSRLLLESSPDVARIRDLQVTSPKPYHYTTKPLYIMNLTACSTAARNIYSILHIMIGYWHDKLLLSSVRLSVRPSGVRMLLWVTKSCYRLWCTKCRGGKTNTFEKWGRCPWPYRTRFYSFHQLPMSTLSLQTH